MYWHIGVTDVLALGNYELRITTDISVSQERNEYRFQSYGTTFRHNPLLYDFSRLANWILHGGARARGKRYFCWIWENPLRS